MSKPIIHARSSAKKWGGVPEDYLVVHELMDSSKSAHASVAHRSVFHTAFGCYLVEKIVGMMITNSDHREVCVRDIAEQHCIEDMGFIPSLSHFLDHMDMQPWMAGTAKAVFAKARALGKDKELIESIKLRKPELRIVFTRDGKEYPVGPFKVVSQRKETLWVNSDNMLAWITDEPEPYNRVWVLSEWAKTFLPTVIDSNIPTWFDGFHIEPV